MLHSKFQTSGPSGSEEEDLLIYFYAFLWFEPRTPWCGAILDPGTFICSKLVKNHLAIVHTVFQASKPRGSEKEAF